MRSRINSQSKPQATQRAETKSNTGEAFRYNTLGVAYMNQQKFAEAQKYFEKALAADPKFAVARLNLGIALLSQQKLGPARAALEEATRLLPNDPYAWYNLGLVYKDTGEPEKAIDAFQHVAQLSPEATLIISSAIFIRSFSATTKPSPNSRRRSQRFHITPLRSSASRARFSARATRTLPDSTWSASRKSRPSILALHSERDMAIRVAFRSPSWAAVAC